MVVMVVEIVVVVRMGSWDALSREIGGAVLDEIVKLGIVARRLLRQDRDELRPGASAPQIFFYFFLVPSKRRKCIVGRFEGGTRMCRGWLYSTNRHRRWQRKERMGQVPNSNTKTMRREVMRLDAGFLLE